MSNCSVLRIGPIDSENGNASALRDAITSHFHDNGASAPSTADNRSDKNSSLTISNRYFDANVLLLELDQPINESSAKAIIHEEDGILLIFDASLSTSFDTLGQFHATAMQNDRAGELLRLCIGATHGPSPLSDGSKKSEEEYSRRVLWCLDHGYEYVEVDLTPEGMARGHDERDKDGFARVVEAIGTCMWSSHVMKKRNVGVGRIGGAVGGGAGATASSKDSKNDASSNNNNTAGGGGSKPESQLNATKSKSEGNETKETTTITSSSPTNDVEREEAAMASLMKDIDSDKPADSDGNADSKKKEAMQQQKSQQQDEMAFHQLESVLSEAKLIREASKNNSMSDDERRERAGDTAMKLMGLLDSLGFDDEDTENEGCCSSSSDEEGA